MSFKNLNLNTPLLNALDDMGFDAPTAIQAKAFPVIMSGQDVVGIAQTGTGKTFAYLLPILRQFKYTSEKSPRFIIIVPTRELVVQIVGEVEKLAKYMTVRVAGVYGGTGMNTQKQVIHNGLDILVATPGRLVDLVLSGVLRLKMVQRFVIDEVDEMLSLGFRPQILSFLDMLPAKKQILMFSATLNTEVSDLIDTFAINPAKVVVNPSGSPLANIVQIGFHVPNFYTKVNLLEYLLGFEEEFSKVLVFVGNKRLANRLKDQMTEHFANQVGVIHANKSLNTRLGSLNKLEGGSFRVLICTDIAARGLDIDNVSHVINFDTPDVPEEYIHRIGRTGRAEKEGVAITFINAAEEPLQKAIEVMMEQPIPIEPIPKEVVISDMFTDEERPVLYDKDYHAPAVKSVGGAFHEKKEKNKKVNIGGPGVRTPRKTKPVNRGVLRKRAIKKRNLGFEE